MAINYPDYMPSYTMGETEEERRRREEEEAAARAAAATVQTFPVEPVAPITPVALEPIDLANTEVQSTQVKTYGDGSQEEIVKRQIPAEPPAAPVQPEPQPQVQAPPQVPQAQPQAAVAPQQTTDPAEIQRRQQAMRVMMAQSQQPAPAPAPTQAVAPTPMPDIGNVQASIGQPPVPGPGVQVAGPAAMPPAAVAAPAANLQQVSAQMGAAPAPAAAPTFDSRFAAASADAVQLLQLRQDATLTNPQRQLAGRQAQLILEQELGPIKAKDQISNMTESELARVLKSRSEEGSWTKLALLGFISPELAGKEAAKLGLNDKWSASTTSDGTPVLVKTRDGVPIEGYNAKTDKALSAKELVAATAGVTGKLDIVGGTYISDTLKDKDGNALVGRVITDQKSGRSYIETDEGRKPMAGFRPQASGGSLDQQRVAQIQRQNVELAGDWAKLQMQVQSAAPEAANKYLGEFNAKHGTRYGLSQLTGAPPQISLETGQMTRAPMAAPGAAAPAPAVTAPQPAQAAPAAAPQPAARPTGPVAPTAMPPAAAPAVGSSGRSPADIEQQKALNLKAGESQIDINRNLEEQKNKVRMAMPASEVNVTRVLNTLNDIVTHPGLDKTVGYPKIMTDVLDKIPSSERRAFRQKYDQLSGQEFLAAYNELRGGGGISETEGLKAEKAISALKDTGISAKDFKQNMWILRDSIQVGHDKQRQLIGQPPKYQESPQREEAKAWLRENPNSPKAEAVRKKLVGF